MSGSVANSCVVCGADSGDERLCFECALIVDTVACVYCGSMLEAYKDVFICSECGRSVPHRAARRDLYEAGCL